MKETLYLNNDLAIVNFSAGYATTGDQLLNSSTFSKDVYKRQTRFTFAELYDKDGKAMEVAKTPMQIITAKVPCVMEKDAMIRKVMKKDRSAIY